MTIDPRLDELLLQWEELRDQGQAVDVAELCKAAPELTSEVRRRVAALEAMNWMVPRAGAVGPPLPRETAGGDDPTESRGSPSVDDQANRLHPGAEPLPGYTLLQRLGRGGFGEVWKAKAPGGFHVALKFVALETRLGDSELRALELIKELRHAHLVPVFGSWIQHRWLIVAMELADRTLQNRYEEAVAEGQQGIPLTELLEYMRGAAEALNYLHTPRRFADGTTSPPLQHRDIKPHNILLVGRHAKVADYGLIRVLENNNTHSGQMTPAYAAPEFFHNKSSAHSDQYSLAVSYCQLRGGRLPFTGSTAQIISGHLSHSPDLSMLPIEERSVVHRALSKSPDARWPSCQAFIQALVQKCTPVESARPRTKPQEVRELLRVQGSKGVLRAVAFSPDGQRFLAAGDDPTVFLWDVKGRSSYQRLPGHEAPILAVAFGNSKSIGYSVDQRGTVIEWDLAKFEETRRLPLNIAEVTSAVFHTGRNLVFLGTRDARVLVEDLHVLKRSGTVASRAEQLRKIESEWPGPSFLNEQQLKRTLLQRDDDDDDGGGWFSNTFNKFSTYIRGVFASDAHDITTLAVTADGGLLFVGQCDDSAVNLSQVDNLIDVKVAKNLKVKRKTDNEPQPAIVRCLALMPDSATAYSGCENGLIIGWDTMSGVCLSCMEHAAPVMCVTVSPDGRWLLSGSADGTSQLWDLAECKPIRVLRSTAKEVRAVAFSPDGRRVVTAGTDQNLSLWDLGELA